MLPINGLNESQQKERRLFAEYHYSCLQASICMKLNLDNIENRKCESVDEVLLHYNDLITFFTHGGRIRDYIKRMGDLLNKKHLSVKFEKQWYSRNIILHKKILPHAIRNQKFQFVYDLTTPELDNHSDEEKKWSDFEPDDLKDLNLILKEHFTEAMYELNGCLATLYNSIKQLQKKTLFVLVDVNDKTIIGGYSGISGSTGTDYNIRNQSSDDLSSMK